MKKTTTYENDIRQKEKQQAEQIQKEKVKFAIFGSKMEFLVGVWDRNGYFGSKRPFFLKIRPEIGIFYLTWFG